MAFHVFISYRRDGGAFMANLLYYRLKNDGYEPFLDIEKMDSGRFDEQIVRRIAECDDFVLVLSENALDRCSDEADWVRREIHEALRLKKNIIPVMAENFSAPQNLPQEIENARKHHGVRMVSDYIGAGYSRLKDLLSFRPDGSSPAPEAPAQPNARGSSEDFDSKRIYSAKLSHNVLRKDALDTVSRSDILSITFVNTLKDRPRNAWNVAEANSAPIMMWKKEQVGGFDLYIATDGIIDLPKDSSSLFYNCTNLKQIYFGNVCDTSSVTDMSDMFGECSSLTQLDLSSFNTESVTDMNGMFYGCSSLTRLDISSFNTQSVTDMTGMFSGCSALTQLDLSSFNTQYVTNMFHMFNECSSLTGLNLSSFDTRSVLSMSYMFCECSALARLDISSFNTQSVKSMCSMFSGCYSLTQLDLSSFDTRSVIDMNFMFRECAALTRLDLSSFNTQSVTNMGNMFDGCVSLTELDISSFDTRFVTNMVSMFSGCSALKHLNLSSFNTQSVTKMGSMFNGCRSLTELNLFSFDTQSVTHMAGMFYKCSALTHIDLSLFNTQSVTSIESMFNGCSALTHLNLSSFNTERVTNMKYLFANCRALKTILIGEKFTVCENSEHMCTACGTKNFTLTLPMSSPLLRRK